MPVIMKDNVQYAYTTKGTVFHTLSNAEYEALTEEEKMNGDVYCIPDRDPVINPDQLWEKVGTDELTTTAQDLSGAVNELNSNLTPLVNRLNGNNKGSVADIIAQVSMTSASNISLISTNASTCNTLGGGNESGMVLCKYFPTDNIINYIVVGKQISIGKINTSTQAVTISKTYS